MDKEQVIAALEKYEERLRGFNPERMSGDEMMKTIITLGHRRALGHVAWMCTEAKTFVAEDRMEKAMRWLGFIQGVLWMTSFFSVSELKVDNMPKGEEFDADRV
jgi:hypothetical protein